MSAIREVLKDYNEWHRHSRLKAKSARAELAALEAEPAEMLALLKRSEPLLEDAVHAELHEGGPVTGDNTLPREIRDLLARVKARTE